MYMKSPLAGWLLPVGTVLVEELLCFKSVLRLILVCDLCCLLWSQNNCLWFSDIYQIASDCCWLTGICVLLAQLIINSWLSAMRAYKVICFLYCWTKYSIVALYGRMDLCRLYTCQWIDLVANRSEFALEVSLWSHFSYARDNDVCTVRCNVRFLYCLRVPIRYRSALCSMLIIDFIMCCFDQGVRLS